MIEAPPQESPPPYRRDRAPWGLLEIGIVFFVVLAALAVVSTAIALVLNLVDAADDPMGTPRGVTVQLVGQMLLHTLAVGAAAGFSLAKYGLPPEAWSLVRPPRLNVGPIFLTLAAAFATLTVYAAIVSVLGLESFLPDENVPRELFDYRAVLPLTFVMVVIVAPLMEEMFFRGFLFHGVWWRFGFWPAAVVSGATFSLIHVTSADLVGLIIPFTVIGILFAYLVRRTGSLWNAIAVHVLFNSVAVAGYLATRVAQ